MKPATRIAVVAAGCLAGVSGAATAGSTHSTPARVAPRQVHRCTPAAPRFHSRHDVDAVPVCVSRPAAGVAPGYVMITPKKGAGHQHSLEMLDDAGQVVWYLPRRNVVNDLKVLTYRGQQMLAWHEELPGWHGLYFLMDDHYRIVRRIAVGSGLDTDMHELQITPQGTALLGAHPEFRSPHSGRIISDYLLRELDLRSGAVRFQWHARYHVPIGASYHRGVDEDGYVDYFHGNSIRMMPDGNLLVSARNTSAVYDINRRTGAVVWTLGGRRDSFDLVSKHGSWRFCHQHDAIPLPDGHVLLFDNGGSAVAACPDHMARAEEFALDPGTRTVRLVRQFSSYAASPDGRGYHAWYVGSARRLSNGDTIVSWGQIPHVTEFTRTGRVNFDLTLGSWTYRAVREQWVGLPLTKPAIAAARQGRTVMAWASWNGATRVASWTLLAGRSRSSLVPVGVPVGRTGFETKLTARTSGSFLAVRASDASGQSIGTSRIVAR